MTRRFDAIIIGAGQAGPALAGRLTTAAMSVAIIERKLFGGTCVNTGPNGFVDNTARCPQPHRPNIISRSGTDQEAFFGVGDAGPARAGFRVA